MGENFVAKMHEALVVADRVVALFSRAYFEDIRYTTEEWTSALVHNEAGDHRLVPVQIEPCVVPGLLSSLLRVELFEVDEAEATRRLLAAARGPARPDGKPVFPGQGQAGVMTGQGYAGPRRPGVLPAVWNVGPRNPAFVGRDSVLQHVRQQFRSAGTTVAQALHGMGGVGKTQVAIEYAHRYAGSYDLVWWVSAEATDLIGEQLAVLAVECGLTSPQADTVSAVWALRTYLRGHSRWLLVFDSAESPRELRDWLPGGPGHVLITSRNPGWGELANRVEVNLFSRSDSVELIHASAPSAGAGEVGRLAEALGDLPLALAQAAGFLAETGMPVDRYLALLETRAEEMLDQNPPYSHPNSLAAAIRVSTDQLTQVDPVALALVRIGAFLAPEPIPTGILIGHVAATGFSRSPELEALILAVSNPVAAHRSLGTIASYGLARIDRGLQLHRLAQSILREQLVADVAADYRSYAQELLVAASPGEERDPESWPSWARILPHLLAVNPATSSSPDLRNLACRAVWYLFYRGESHLARGFAEQLYLRWSEQFGADDRHTLWVAHPLIRVLTDIGPHRETRQLGEDTLARSRRVLGEDHPDTLQAAHHLANCLHEMGAFEEARQLNVDTVARRRRVLGADHIDVLRTSHSLAENLYGLGEVETARRLHEESLAYRRRALGEDHPYTIVAVKELGRELRALGQAEGARRLHEDSLGQARRVLGEDHLWTVDCANNLAADLLALGEAEAARQLSEDTLARARRIAGNESHFTTDAANNLAAALHAVGEYDDAQQLSEDTLACTQRVFGEEHPHTRKAAENLAAVRRRLDRTDE